MESQNVSFVFLLNAKDENEAGAYCEALKKNRVRAIADKAAPTGLRALPDSAIATEDSGAAGAASAITGEASGAAGAASAARPGSVNIYVDSGQIELARRVVDDFDSQPIVYGGPPPVLNQKSRSSQIVFAICMVLIFVIPLGVALMIVTTRIVRFFMK